MDQEQIVCDNGRARAEAVDRTEEIKPTAEMIKERCYRKRVFAVHINSVIFVLGICTLRYNYFVQSPISLMEHTKRL